MTASTIVQAQVIKLLKSKHGGQYVSRVSESETRKKCVKSVGIKFDLLRTPSFNTTNKT